MKIKLNIPFAEKDAAKLVAKKNKIPLWYENGSWQCETANDLIKEFKPYYVEANQTKEAINFINQFQLKSKTSIKTKIGLKPTKEKPVAKNSLNKTSKTAYPDNYSYVLNIPYELRNDFPQMGNYYNSEEKVIVNKSKFINEALHPYFSEVFSLESFIEKKLNGFIRSELTNKISDTQIFVPRDYQNEAEKAILLAIQKELRGFLLADEVGLGKTISSCLVLKQKQFKKILVVTTLSATPHWRNTLVGFPFKDKEIVVINYDRLQKLFSLKKADQKLKRKTRKAKNKRIASKGECEDFDIIIWDESHKMKNQTSMRSKLGKKLMMEAGFNLYLSATAGQNPLELSYMSELLAQLTGQSVKNLDDYEKWCLSMKIGVSRGDFGKWLWDGSDESIKKIQDILFNGKIKGAIRRTPANIKGYPEISRQLFPLSLDADEQKKYEMFWEEFKNDSLKLSANKNKKPQKGELNQLVVQLRLRQKCSLLKVPHTYSQAIELLENGHQVAISVGFKDCIKELVELFKKAGYSCSIITGDEKPKEKEANRVAFQKGENKIAIFTVEEAISLHQGEMNNVPRSMIIHDLRWSAISMSQIEGRTHRDGKFSQIYWCYFEKTIEEEIANIVLQRVIGMKGMVGDDTAVLKDILSALSLKAGFDIK